MLIRDGDIVAFPTETVYGLGADAFDALAVAVICAKPQRICSRPSADWMRWDWI